MYDDAGNETELREYKNGEQVKKDPEPVFTDPIPAVFPDWFAFSAFPMCVAFACISLGTLLGENAGEAHLIGLFDLNITRAKLNE